MYDTVLDIFENPTFTGYESRLALIKTYLFKVFLMISCLLNAAIGGKAYQSFSVRNWDWKRRGLFNLVAVIDYCLGKDHCMESWVSWRIARDNTKVVRKEYRDAEEKYYDSQW